jgi:hypothetical protein
MYKSLFKISTPEDALISAAVTFHDFDFDSFNHSIHVSFLLKTKPFKFSIISIILSFTQGRVEYSCVTQVTFIHVILVPGIEERRALLSGFPKVTPYHFGNGHTVNEEVLASISFCVIFGTPIVLCIICIF